MQPYNKYSNTCEEGEAQFRISVWHLLMNLKKTTIKKTVEMDQKKKKEKHLEILLFYNCVPKTLMI